MFGGPWTYDRRTNREATDVDRQVLADAMQTGEASVVGRRMYDITGGWDGSSPFGPCIVVTHRVEEPPDPASGFEFVSGVEAAIDRARVEDADAIVARADPLGARGIRRRPGRDVGRAQHSHRHRRRGASQHVVTVASDAAWPSRA